MSQKFKSKIDAQEGVKIDKQLYDSSNSSGTSGQILSSTGSATSWINQSDVAAGESDKALSLTLRVKNTESVALSKGQVVCAAPSATPPSGNVIEVKLADNNGTDSMPAIGILNEDLDAAGGANDEGEAIMFGRISGIDTSAFSVGDEVFVSDTAGGLTTTKPTGVKYIQKIGVVMRDHASNGAIEVFGAGRTNDVPTPLYIDHANQRLGIGTASPSKKLDVVGDARFSGSGYNLDITGGANLVGSNQVVLKANASYARIESNANNIYLRTGAGVIVQNGSGVEQMRFTQTGRIGIGTTNPAAPLTIANANGGSWNDGLIIDDPTGWAATVYKRNNVPKMFTGLYNGNDNYIWMSSGYNNAGTTITAPRTDAVLMARPATDDLQIYLDTHFGGNVGIGTTSPQDKLDVHGDIRVSYDASNYFTIEPISNGNVFFKPTGGSIHVAKTSADNKLFLYDYLDATTTYGTYSANLIDLQYNGVVTAKINTNGNSYFNGGNVGIGTTSPEEKLHVSSGDNSNVSVLVGQSTSWGDGSIRFKTGSTNYMGIGFTSGTSASNNVIDAIAIQRTGNVGIGTTSPQQKLQVASPSATSVVLGASYLSTNNNNFFEAGINANDGYLNLRNSGVSTTVHIDSDGDSYFNGGNVGIGTTSPGASLHVASTTTDFVAKFSHTTATGYAPGSILLQAGQSTSRGQGLFHYNTEADESWFTGVPYNVTSRKWIVANKPDTTFNPDVAQLSYALLTIDSDTGNVGIGTTSPSSLLHLESASSPMLQIKDTTNNVTFKAYAQDSNTHLANVSNHDLFIDTNNTARITVKSSGNVGIGTTSPAEKLEVIGEIKANAGNDEGFILNGNNGFLRHLGTGAKIRTNGLDALIIDNSQNAAIQGSGSTVFDFTVGRDLSVTGTATFGGNVAIGDTLTNYTNYNTLTIGSNSASEIGLIKFKSNYNSGNGAEIYQNPSGKLYFNSNSSTTAMTLDVSGNLSVTGGVTATDLQINLVGTNTAIIQGENDAQLRMRGTNDAWSGIGFLGSTGTQGYLYHNSIGEYFQMTHRLDALSGISIPDSQNLNIGASNALILNHNGTSSYIDNYTGNLIITNYTDDGDINFLADDGTGGNTVYFQLDGSLGFNVFWKNVRHLDGVTSTWGASDDLQIFHNGIHSFINNAGTGEIIFQDAGSNVWFSASNGIYFYDGKSAYWGSGADLQIIHSSGENLIRAINGDLRFKALASGNDIHFDTELTAGTEHNVLSIYGGSETFVRLRHNNSTRLDTTSTGVDITGTLDVSDTITGTAIQVGSNPVWHAGNDGSGSGLDADLLDGQHGSYYTNASNLNSGIVPEARLPEFFEEKFAYQSNDSNAVYTPMVKGGLYGTTSSSVTGAIRIDLPAYKSNAMINFYVDIYEYSIGETVTFRISGYAYGDTGATWHNCSVVNLSDDNNDYNVRFVSDTANSKQCVIIGETTTNWTYPQVLIRDAFGGYNTAEAEWKNSWNISFVTSIVGTVRHTFADNLPYADWDRLEGKPSTFAPSSHNHNNLYYTESESDSRFVNVTGDTMTGDLTIDKNTPRIDFKADSSGANVGARIELNENGNIWVNAQGGKDLWLNWLSPTSPASKADLQVGDGNSGSAILTVQGSTRRVGIGTTNPENALHLVTSTSDATQQLLIQNGGAGDAAIKFNISGDTYSLGIDNSDGDKFKLSAGNLGVNDRLVVDSTGNVGIGTTSPGEKLHVNGNLHVQDTTPTLKIQSDNSYPGAYIDFTNISDNLTSRIYSYSNPGGSGLDLSYEGPVTAYSSKIQLKNGYMYFLTAGSIRGTINSAGNFGIGITSPRAKFHAANGTLTTWTPISGTTGIFESTASSRSFVQIVSANEGELWFSDAAAQGRGRIRYQHTDDSIRIWTNGSEKMSIGSGGGTTFTSTVTATNFILSSDERVKENIEDLAPTKLNVNWKTFNMKSEDEDNGKRYGVIAQELEEKHPEFVNTDDEGFKSVKYIDLLVAKIAELEARLEKLEK